MGAGSLNDRTRGAQRGGLAVNWVLGVALLCIFVGLFLTAYALLDYIMEHSDD